MIAPPLWIGYAFAAGLLLGSIPFAQIFASLRGIDLHKVGSGNIGATNAARALGKPIGVLVLILDAGKAAGPMLAARAIFGDKVGEELAAALALGAVLGHMYTPWLRFRGGKGVATGFGAFLVLAPLAAAIAAGLWVLSYAVTRTSSIGSLVAVASLPIAVYLLGGSRPALLLALALLPIIVWRHRDNIKRLRSGDETKV